MFCLTRHALSRVQQYRALVTSLGMHQFSARLRSLRSGETHNAISSGGLNKPEMRPLIASGASHFGVLTDRAPFDRVLPTGAETRLVRGQKDRHGGDLLNGAHTIEG